MANPTWSDPLPGAVAASIAERQDSEPNDSGEQVPVGVDRFLTTRTLGEGGMGRVVEALDRQFQRVVAVKEMRGPATANARRRFVQEALVTAHLEHAGIPVVYERGRRGDGALYYAMRRVNGSSLAERLDRTAVLTDRLALVPLIAQVADTLAFAHSRGVVHRDLKPENIVLGAHGEVVVVDWGLAQVRGVPTTTEDGDQGALDPKLTRHGTVLGTPAYMAPEQARGEIDRIDERTDVFALGALLYHVLSGRSPYGELEAKAIVAAAARAGYAPLAEVAPGAPVGLRAIAERAMAPDPDRRYAHAGEFAAALRSLVVESLSDGPAPWLSHVAGVVTTIMFLASLLIAIAVPLRYVQLGVAGLAAWIALPTLDLTLLLCSVEWWTRGRYRLSPLILATVGATASYGIGATGLATMRVLDRVSVEPIVSDELQFRELLAAGIHEALGGLVAAMGFTTLQLVLWAAVRRSTRS